MIAEDQTMVRQALVALLELEPDIDVVAEAGGGDEALAMASKHQPDVAVLDIEMPGPGGIEVARRLSASGFPGKIVIVTTFGRPGYLRAARTSVSRWLSGLSPSVSAAAASAESTTRSPAATRRMASASSAAGASLRRKPLAPAAIAARR